MALFGRGEKKEPSKETPEGSVARPVMGREALCRLCNKRPMFSRCWLRVDRCSRCSCCGLVFDDLNRVYGRIMPTCPRCGEYLEQPGFEYGLCDVCGSKYELVAGTKPSLLPNKAQRAAMEKRGRAWRPE